MDTDDLSQQAYAVLSAAARDCDTLKSELGAMASRFLTEDAWLNGVRKHLNSILRKPAAYVDYWGLEKEDGISPKAISKLAGDLVKQVDEVLAMPLEQRGPSDW